MLILFDIDGTILRTHGAGVAAMEDAGRELFGSAFCYDGIETAGRLDTLIWNDLCARNGIADAIAHHDRFRATYARCLERRLSTADVRLMPGVRELVQALAAREQVALGLLTGNYPETGRMKIAAAGIDPDLFVVNAWGCDGPSRRDLPPIAMRHYHAQRGSAIASERVTIIGDTPHDIDCARANGCRSLAVATGAFTVDELLTHEPDLAVEHLGDTPSILAWILKGAPLLAE